MEDAADAIVPLRPGFDVQFRGFDRNQVIEHIELLEDQLKIVTIDRNEAVALNTDLRRLCDDTRNNLTEAEGRLKSIETSDTGLPAASQRVQNMLTIAEEEVQTLRDQARRQAEIIRGSAETEANALIAEAEKHAGELRAECAALVADLEERRDQFQREHNQQIKEMREQEQRMRQSVRNEYKRLIAEAEEESDELLNQTRRQCGQMDTETEQHRLDVLEELRKQRNELESIRDNALAELVQVQDALNKSSVALHTTIGSSSEPGSENGHGRHAVDLPEPRETAQVFTVAVEQPHNGDNPASDQTGLTDTRDTAGRN